MIIISTGCPASIGPEVSLRAAAAMQGGVRVLVGDEATLIAAARLVGVPVSKLRRSTAKRPRGGGIYVLPSGPELTAADRVPGKPSAVSGQAQLQYVEDAYALAKLTGGALVTAAVSKAAIANSGLRRAKSFRGHTEWLERLDRSEPVTMCFYSDKLSTSLVTTHLPLRKVPRAIERNGVSRATRHLSQLLRKAGIERPRLVVTALNPHAGEDELLGTEESKSIVVGVADARKKLQDKARVVGPIGAETAFRLAAAGQYDGVVAMYHDQATIPMKLLAFGDAVNVTMGLSIVRTSVDHGTAYDIAWTGKADPSGMIAAVALAQRLSRSRRPD